eukprot:TRINITY_DN58170_c0_g1_i1.p1 TRINITY_DN58170_c0_g1~~TRINITY_DN58170_c0_g1_i1.p1  ORF type:complete len:215 (-),score=29.50 TRINITY_DN58170_c0_g1_i1:101-745(-)
MRQAIIFLFLSALRIREGGAAFIAEVGTRRTECIHYQHMMCALDVVEKLCKGDEEDPFALMKWRSIESIWICCCPEPYRRCNLTCMNKACMRSINEHFREGLVEKTSEFVFALQKVRGDLREDGGEPCEVFAPEQPWSICGGRSCSGRARSIQRRDLFCELITWQFEELGDGNFREFEENGCPYFPWQRPLDGEDRKGGRLRGRLPVNTLAMLA